MSTNKVTFTPDAGGFIHKAEAQRLRDNYCNKRRKKDPADSEFVQAFFFGKDKLKALLDCQEDIAGLRIYFGDDHEHEDQEHKKMVIYAVNSKGQNVLFRDCNVESVEGIAGTEGSELRGAQPVFMGAALDRGLPCPTNCGEQGTV